MPHPLAERTRDLDGRVVDPFTLSGSVLGIGPLPDRGTRCAIPADVLAELLEIFRRHFIVLTLRRLSRA